MTNQQTNACCVASLARLPTHRKTGPFPPLIQISTFILVEISLLIWIEFKIVKRDKRAGRSRCIGMVYPALQDCILFQQWKKYVERRKENIVGAAILKHQQWRKWIGGDNNHGQKWRKLYWVDWWGQQPRTKKTLHATSLKFNWLSTDNYQLSTINYQLSTINYQLLSFFHKVIFISFWRYKSFFNSSLTHPTH